MFLFRIARFRGATLFVSLIVSTMSFAAEPSRAPRTPESAILPVNLNPDRHAQFLARIKQGPVDLLFLGDSITDAWPQKSPETWAKFAAYHPADFGVSGERTENLLWRLQNGELDGIQPKVVVLLIGTNNTGHFPEEQPAWVADGVRQILGTIHAKLPATRVLLLAIFPRDARDSSTRKRNDATNLLLEKYDSATTDYLDIGHIFVDANGEIRRDLMPDLLHPEDAGYRLWYDAMQPTLDQMLK